VPINPIRQFINSRCTSDLKPPPDSHTACNGDGTGSVPAKMDSTLKDGWQRA
jgi:hypothetical protein